MELKSEIMDTLVTKIMQRFMWNIIPIDRFDQTLSHNL